MRVTYLSMRVNERLTVDALRETLVAIKANISDDILLRIGTNKEMDQFAFQEQRDYDYPVDYLFALWSRPILLNRQSDCAEFAKGVVDDLRNLRFLHNSIILRR